MPNYSLDVTTKEDRQEKSQSIAPLFLRRRTDEDSPDKRPDEPEDEGGTLKEFAPFIERSNEGVGEILAEVDGATKEGVKEEREEQKKGRKRKPDLEGVRGDEVEGAVEVGEQEAETVERFEEERLTDIVKVAEEEITKREEEETGGRLTSGREEEVEKVEWSGRDN